MTIENESLLGLCIHARGVLEGTKRSIGHIIDKAACDIGPYREAFELLESVTTPESQLLDQWQNNNESGRKTNC